MIASALAFTHSKPCDSGSSLFNQAYQEPGQWRKDYHGLRFGRRNPSQMNIDGSIPLIPHLREQSWDFFKNAK
jgi:hypothetical protein